jgi:hypothetical protein
MRSRKNNRILTTWVALPPATTCAAINSKACNQTPRRATRSRRGNRLSDLATGVGLYNMGNNKLQNLGAAGTTGDALSFGQTGGQLNGLNLNNSHSPIVAGKWFGTGGRVRAKRPQLTTTSGAIVVRTSSNVIDNSLQTTKAINAPAGIVNGDVENRRLAFS